MGGALSRLGGVDRWVWASEVRIATRGWERLGEVGWVDVDGLGKRQGARGKKQGARGKRQEARGKRQEARGKRQEARGKRHEARGKRPGARGKARAMIQDLTPPPHPPPTTIPKINTNNNKSIFG